MEAEKESSRKDLLIEKCGVFGCVAAEGQDVKDLGVPNVICLGLVGLQHRGQESAGIVTSDGTELYKRKKMGLVGNVFGEDDMKALPGHFGIGHTRYSTAGKSELVNCQPFVVDSIHGWISVAHNGELTNAKVLRKKLLRQGVGLSTGSDTEIITQLLTAAPTCGKSAEEADWPSRIRSLMQFTELAYSLLILTSEGIFGLRDPHGNRPLCLGQLLKVSNCKSDIKIEDSEPTVASWVISSESCAFTSIGATYMREVQPGEIVQITRQGIKSIGIVPRQKAPDPSFCIFEYVYFARADSWLEGQMVYKVRKECGRQLAVEAPVEGEVVSTVPESATPAAFGFSEISGIPYVEVFTKNRYVGRTFIQPSTHLRQSSISKKFGPLSANFEGKRVVIVDDSIVRGHTMKPIIKLLKENGAKEVHIRIASPPLRYPCYMGINIPTRDELIANKMTIQELGVELGADSLEYLSIEGLVSAVQKGIPDKEEGKVGHCTACLSGKYPVELEW